ncbi:hypothetical protein S0112_077 [Shewanella phage S0112]|nr:hypothetical protein S0112_077 [Shewanella phage S0112]
MASFSHLKKLEVTQESTTEFTFYDIDGAPTLICRPATEANPAYLNALLKENGQLKKDRKKIVIDQGMLDIVRQQDRRIFPEANIVGWYDVVDDTGESVPFSKEAAQEFISFLPDWLFDKLRAHLNQPKNFIIDSEEKGKN